MIEIPSRVSVSQDLEQLRCLLRREHGGRLVEDDDVGIAVERLHDLHALLLPHRDVLNAGMRIDREVERLRDVGNALLGC